MKRSKVPYGLMILLMVGMMLTAAADTGHVVTREPSQEEEETDEKEELTKQEVLNQLPIDETEKGIREIRQDFHVALPSSLDFVIDPFEKAGRGQVFSEVFQIKNSGLGNVRVTISELHAEKGTEQARKNKIKKDLTIGYSADQTIGESREEPALSYKIKKKEPDPEERTPGKGITIGYSGKDEAEEEPEPEPEELTIGESEELTIGESTAAKAVQTSGNITFEKEPVDYEIETTEKKIQLSLHRIDEQEADVAIMTENAEPIELILGPGEKAEYEITGTINPFPQNEWKAGDISVKAVFSVEVLEAEEAERLKEQRERKKQAEKEEPEEKPVKIISPKLHTKGEADSEEGTEDA